MIDLVKGVCREDTIFVADMSSSLGSRDLTKEDLWEDLGVIYAGAQKNMGASDLTYLIVREDILEDIYYIRKDPVPQMMDWLRQSQVMDNFVNT